jgi:hypothetical protein
MGTVDDMASFHPLAANVSLAEPLETTARDFFSHTWNGCDPHGTPNVFMLATRAGALANGTLTDDEMLGVSTTSFSFAPASNWPGRCAP